jgi:DNA-binding transcriptional regulator YhcF (GntR family)
MLEMRIRIDPNSREPASEQLARSLRSAIERGALAPGERVAPVRERAEELGLAANTVAKAYRTLEAEGLLEGRGRLGTFVADRLPEPLPQVEARLAEAAEGFARRARQLGFGPAEASRAVDRALRR